MEGKGRYKLNGTVLTTNNISSTFYMGFGGLACNICHCL
jgi:hypothetical protein